MKLIYLSGIGLGFFMLAFIFNPIEFNKAKETAPQKITVNPIKQDFIRQFDAWAKKELKRCGQPGAAIAIVMDSTIFYAEGIGIRNSKTKEKVDRNSIFRIGSLSKGFAGVLSGVLVEEGKLHWDDKVKKHLPEFNLYKQENTQALKIDHILSHTSGLPYHAYTDLIERGKSMDEISLLLGNLKLMAMPGKIYSYQNAGYALIEQVMESASDKDYETLISQKLFDPLGMSTASVSKEDLLKNDNIAYPHYRSKRGWRPAKISNKYYNAASAGGVNASILDMGKYLELLLGKREDILKTETIDQVFEPLVNTKNRRKYFQRWPGVKNAHYAKGWRVLEKEDEKIVYHGGYVNNYRSEIALDTDKKIGICVLSNSKGSFSANCIPEFFKMFEQYQLGIQQWDSVEKERIKTMP